MYVTYLFASHVCKYCTCTLLSCQLPDELHKSKTGPCHDLNALSYLIYNRHGFHISFVLTAMVVTGLCPITFANIYKKLIITSWILYTCKTSNLMSFLYIVFFQEKSKKHAMLNNLGLKFKLFKYLFKLLKLSH